MPGRGPGRKETFGGYLDRIFLHNQALNRYWVNEIARGRTTLDFTRGRDTDGWFSLDYDQAANPNAYDQWYSWFTGSHASKYYIDFEGEDDDEQFQNRYDGNTISKQGNVYIRSYDTARTYTSSTQFPWPDVAGKATYIPTKNDPSVAFIKDKFMLKTGKMCANSLGAITPIYFPTILRTANGLD